MSFWKSGLNPGDYIIEGIMCIEEHVSKSTKVGKIKAPVKNIILHLGKIYLTGQKSNWFGTIRKHIRNIEKVVFPNTRTEQEYYRDLWLDIKEQERFIPKARSPIRKALRYDNKPTEEQYLEFVRLLDAFFKWLSIRLASKTWLVSKNKSEIDAILIQLFIDKKI